MQQDDYRLLPIVSSAAKTVFQEDELEQNGFLQDVLEGRISLENRLENIPKFSYNATKFRSARNSYKGATIEELKRALKNGKREVEIIVTKSWLSKFLAQLRMSLEGIIFDKAEKIVLIDEPSLEKKADAALRELKAKREEEKLSLRKIKQVKGALDIYTQQIEFNSWIFLWYKSVLYPTELSPGRAS